MKKIRRIISSFLCLFTVGCVCSCGNKAPDYSKYNDKFNSYAYFSALDGSYYIENVEYNDRESMFTEKQYQLFKESGLTTYMPCHFTTTISNNPTEEWNFLKGIIDDIAKVGINQTLLVDNRIVQLQWTEGTLIGNGKKFATQDALDNFIENCLSLYATYPGVYGIELGDEPRYTCLEAYSEVYKSIKRVCEKKNYNLFIQYNLNPLNMSEYVFDNYYPHVQGTDTYNFENNFIRYKKYIIDFLDAMEPDYIQYDDYPLIVNGIKKSFFPCIQFVCGEAAKRGIEVHIVNQTYSMKVDDVQVTRVDFGEEEARWLNNIMLAFGVKEIDYFTYFSPPIQRKTGESFDNDASFIDHDGNPTQLYYFMQKILGENQKFAPTCLHFEYETSYFVKKKPANYQTPYLSEVDNTQSLRYVKSVSIDKEVALITELKDEENNNVMVSVVNVLDPSLYEEEGAKETVTLEFDSSKYKNALVYQNGVSTQMKLSGGKISLTIKPSEAFYVIPY